MRVGGGRVGLSVASAKEGGKASSMFRRTKCLSVNSVKLLF